jgi:Concanavalin A-like lectin/glucanases superfamily
MSRHRYFPRRNFVRRIATPAPLIPVLLLIATAAGAVGFGGSLVSASSKFSSATLQLDAVTGASSCYSTGTGAGGTVSTNVTSCATGSPLPTGALSATASSSATTVLGSPGTANASAATVTSSTCGVAQLADLEASTDWSGTSPDTGLPLNGLTYGSAGPVASQAITTNGSTGWAETTEEYTNPETFTILAWFKTSSPTGSIIGFSNDQTAPASASDYDRMLWIDPTGHVVWGVYNGATDQVTSTSTYDNGAWHFVVATIGAAGQQLYIDGALAGTTLANTSAQTGYSGWWSIGLSGVLKGGWPDPPTSAYFNGSLAQVAVVPSQLSAAQVTTLYGDTTLSSFSAAVTALTPANYWPLNDSGSVAFTGTVPGASATTLTDASGNGNTGTAEGGLTLGSSGPTSLGATANAIALDGSTGYVQTTTSYANPEGTSEVAWFKTSTTTGGSIMGFTNVQSNGTPGTWDRTIWIDNTGHLVFGTYNGATDEVTSPSTYNNGQWHLVVAEIGAAGQELWVDGTEVASNTAYTTAQNYTGYWHLGWGYESTWPDAPTNNYLLGSLSEAAIIPSQLTAGQISSLYTATSATALAATMTSLTPTSYWPLQDTASGVCGTTEITVQQVAGSTTSCIYPAGTGACPAPNATYLVTGLGSRALTVPTAATSVSITITMKLSAASPAGVLGLHELPGIEFGSSRTATLWSALLGYQASSVQL